MNKFLSMLIVLMLASIAFATQADGEKLYNSLGCAACHGAGGKSVIPNYPSLNGQHAVYIIKQLKDFQSGARKDPTMNAMAAVTVGHEKEIADYLNAQKIK